MEKEIWKDIPQYEGHYQVSSLGRVRSIPRGNRKGRVLKQFENAKYKKLSLSKDGVERSFNVHVLVAMAFLGHVPGGYALVVDHIDNDRLNNNLNNLQLVTARENTSKDRRGGSSKYVGVSWHKNHKKWISNISVDGKQKHLGYFKNEIDAHNAYQNYLKNNL